MIPAVEPEKIKGFRRLSFPIIIYFLGLTIVGLCLAPLLPIKLVPTKTLPRISVSFSMKESPRVVESKVTSQIEAILGRINGVNSITSTSTNRGGNIDLLIDKNKNLDAIRFEISTAIRQIWPKLPQGTSYPSINIGYSSQNASSPFITYTLNAPSTPNLICDYAEKQIRPSLSQIDGISDIRISGAQPMEWVLEYDYSQLNQIGISINDIQTAISSYLGSTFLGLGNVQGNTYCSIYLKPQTSGSKQFDTSAIPVKEINGKIIYLNDLVKSEYKEQEPQNYFRINGLNTISLTIYANKQANQIQLSKQVRAELKKLEKNFPYGYELDLKYDASEYVKNEIKNVALRSGLAILILLLFVLILSKNWRYMGVIATALIANISIAFIFYYLLGIEIQIYSISGITISLGLVIDNIIVMADHLLHRNKMNVFIAILAATLTTIASLSVIFMLDESVKLNLQDFALVLIINLTVSLFIALFLIPALLEKSGLIVSHTPRIAIIRRIVQINNIHAAILRFLCRWRKTAFLLLIIGFGIPLYLLPPTLPENSKIAHVYNKIFPFANKLLGGSLRMFMEHSPSKNDNTERGESQLNISAHMPNGVTLDEMNETVKQMEYYISQYNGVKQFQTNIHSPLNAYISVTFTKEAEQKNVPYRMQEDLISKANNLGNATWSITGIGNNFQNRVNNDTRKFQIELLGYNYDELIKHANNLKKVLLSYKRVKDLQIVPNKKYNNTLYEEYVFDAYTERLTYNGLQISNLYSSISSILMNNSSVGTISGDNGSLEHIKLQSKQSHSYNIWDLNNHIQNIQNQKFRLGWMTAITKQQAPQEINKINQQYRLYIEYNYLGNYSQGSSVHSIVIQQFSTHLPMGYSIQNANNNIPYFYLVTKKISKEYWALVSIIFIIYIICSILNNSFKQPLAIIFIIPISFIGIFLSFSYFNLSLNQGGFAAFVLLSGLTCNSAIYLLNDYNSLRRKGLPKGIKTYIRSLNHKITPILMTFLSTALGFLPFIFAQENDNFWLPLATGTICGLFFSLIGIMIYLPIIINGKEPKPIKKA